MVDAVEVALEAGAKGVGFLRAGPSPTADGTRGFRGEGSVEGFLPPLAGEDAARRARVRLGVRQMRGIVAGCPHRCERNQGV